MEDDRDLVEPDLDEDEDEFEEEHHVGVKRACIRFLHKLAEEDKGWIRLAGVGIILLGGILIFVAGFVVKVSMNSSYSAAEVHVYNKGLLIFGAAVIVGALFALLWKISYVGSIFPLAISGLILFEFSGWMLSPAVEFGGGFYLCYAGALLALLGSLICLAQRRTGLVARIDSQDKRVSALHEVVESLQEVWEEADKLAEARIEGEMSSLVDYDNASLKAENSLQDYHEKFGV